MKTQDNIQVRFTVIETLRSTATATVSCAQFKKETGVTFDDATQEQLAEFCVASNIEYKKTSAEERVEDPVFLVFGSSLISEITQKSLL